MRRSELVLLLMTLWWAGPLFILHLAAYPGLSYFTSHLLYLIVIAVAAAFAAVLGVFDKKTGFWHKNGYWGKYLLIMAAYTCQMIFLLLIIIPLDSWGWIRYYGGDAEGSVGMLFLPSIIFYLILGAVPGFILSLARRLRKRAQPDC